MTHTVKLTRQLPVVEKHSVLGSILFLTFFFCFFSSPAPPAEAGVPVHGARAAGMGTAFVGLADDPSALRYNPAGITQIKGTHVYDGITLIMPRSEFHADDGTDETTKLRIYNAPHLYITSDLGSEKLAFGLGLDAPFGIGGLRWDSDGATRYHSVTDYIATLGVNPNLAWQVTPKLSLAAGFSYLYAEMLSVKMLDQSAFNAGDGRAEIEADGDGWGYNFGLLYHFNEHWSAGLAYRSEIQVDFDGDMKLKYLAEPLQPLLGGSRYKTGTASRSTFPEIISCGISFKAGDKLVLNADFEQFSWSSFDEVRLELDQPVAEAGLTDATYALDWKDSRHFKFGGEYRASDSWRYRAGYAFINGAVPEHTRARITRIPIFTFSPSAWAGTMKN